MAQQFQVHEVDSFITPYNSVDSFAYNFNATEEQYDIHETNFSMNQTSVFSHVKDNYVQSSKDIYYQEFIAAVDSPVSTNCSTQSIGKESHSLMCNSPSADTPDFSQYDLNSKENESDEDSDYEEKPVSKKSKAKAQKAPRKKSEKSQNKMKNFPGLITQRVKTSISEMNPFGVALTKKYGSRDVQRVKEFLQNYQKQSKTWASIQSFLCTDPDVGVLLLEFVLEFLHERSSEHFEQYITSGKMNEKNRQTAREGKEFFSKKFRDLIPKIGGPQSPVRSEGYSTTDCETGSMMGNVTIFLPETCFDDFEDSDECYEPCIMKKLKAK